MSSSSVDPSEIKNLDVPGLYTRYIKKGNLWAVFMIKSMATDLHFQHEKYLKG